MPDMISRSGVQWLAVLRLVGVRVVHARTRTRALSVVCT